MIAFALKHPLPENMTRIEKSKSPTTQFSESTPPTRILKTIPNEVFLEGVHYKRKWSDRGCTIFLFCVVGIGITIGVVLGMVWYTQYNDEEQPPESLMSETNSSTISNKNNNNSGVLALNISSDNTALNVTGNGTSESFLLNGYNV